MAILDKVSGNDTSHGEATNGLVGRGSTRSNGRRGGLLVASGSWLLRVHGAGHPFRRDRVDDDGRIARIDGIGVGCARRGSRAPRAGSLRDGSNAGSSSILRGGRRPGASTLGDSDDASGSSILCWRLLETGRDHAGVALVGGESKRFLGVDDALDMGKRSTVSFYVYSHPEGRLGAKKELTFLTQAASPASLSDCQQVAVPPAGGYPATLSEHRPRVPTPFSSQRRIMSVSSPMQKLALGLLQLISVPSGRPCWRWGLAETTAAERATATAAVFMMDDVRER